MPYVYSCHRNASSGGTISKDQVHEIVDEYLDEAQENSDAIKSLNEDNAKQNEEIEKLKQGGAGAVAVDATMSESGKAADAKVTGELFGIAPATSRNLNVTKYVNKTTSGVTFTVNEDNSVSLSGTATEECWALKTNEGKERMFHLMPGTYTFTVGYDGGTNVRGYAVLYDHPDDNKAALQIHSDAQNTNTFTIDTEMYGYVQIAVRPAAGSVDGVTLKMQLEKGNKATEYVSPFAEGVRSARFDDLENRVGGVEKSAFPYSVPSYYFENGYLPGRIEAVKAKMQECMGHGDAFIFITDEHWTQNAQKSTALINYIANNLHITKVISGGDTGNSGGSVDFADEMRKSFPGRVYHVFGNHEYFYPADGDLLAYNMSMYNDDVHTGDPDRNYYYFDNNRAHIRYIVLDSYMDGIEGVGAQTGYEEEQLAWLTDTALDVPDGWGIVLSTHHMYYINPDTMGLVNPNAKGQAVLDALDAYNANESSKGEVICIVQGHTHLDRITHSTGGIPVVITTCDKYMPWIEGDVNKEPWMSNRVAGTITEQAFDIVVIDRENRELNFFRIGADAENGIDDDRGELVNLRTLAY